MGNKRDSAPHERQVSVEEGKYIATQMGCEWYETSAKTNTNVELVFKSLVRQIRARGGGGGDQSGAGAGAGGGRGGRDRGGRKRKKCVVL